MFSGEKDPNILNAFYILKLHIALMEKMHLMMLRKVELLNDVTFQDLLLSISFQFGLFFVCWFCERVKALLYTNSLGQREGFKSPTLHPERLVLDSSLGTEVSFRQINCIFLQRCTPF